MTGLKMNESVYPFICVHSESFDIYITLSQTLGKVQLILCLIYNHAFNTHGGVELIYSHT
jgi:hypothetical protein